jgi:hypothetical protein
LKTRPAPFPANEATWRSDGLVSPANGEGGLTRMRASAWVRGWRVADKSRATAVSLSPQCLRSAPTPDVTRRRRGRNGARGRNRWSRSVASVPPAAQERAPHGGRDEVLRLHLPQTWGIPRRLVAYRIARRSPFQGPRGSSRGWSAPPADHPTQLSASNTRRRRTNGETEIDVWEGLAEVRALSEVFSAPHPFE